MRTTIDLPEDLHRIAAGIARDRRISLSAAVAELMRRGLQPGSVTGALSTSERTGLPVLRLGRPITAADVRALDDDE
jgi:hypothetical protein